MPIPHQHHENKKWNHKPQEDHFPEFLDDDLQQNEGEEGMGKSRRREKIHRQTC
jgi:hypothetical protein